MAWRYTLPLLSIALAHSVRAFTESGQPVFTDLNRGFCYFCSDTGAPPLCNSQCETSISRLCSGDLREPWIDTEGDCELEYRPPVYNFRGGKVAPEQQTCLNIFKSMLNMCGKDASSDATTYDPKYCTSTGGGGTYGWNDDGSTMDGTGRFKIVTKNTNQCGQTQAPWKLGGEPIQWNASWIDEGDQVVYDTHPTEMPPMPEPPAPNPLCNNVTCNIFGQPYYAVKGKPNWQEKGGYMRHQVKWQGWDEADQSAFAFHKSLKARCMEEPYNFQAYKEGDEHVADFELAHTDNNDLCWCIADAIYDASGGITTDRMSWCDGAVTKQGAPEFLQVG
ncbi:MAG: hypothetical protein Q9224_005597 [Gallowayella concinna]